VKRPVILVAVVAICVVLGGGAIALAGQHHQARVVQLRAGDVAVGAGVRCQVTEEAGVPLLLCSRNPRSRSPFDVALTGSSVIIYKAGYPDDPLFGRSFK
jgi:hypothetical protein